MATKAIVGEKVGMTQVWDEENRVVPVTVLRVSACRVVQVKTPEHDGYSAIQVTLGVKDAGKLTRPEAGHFEKAGVDAGRKRVDVTAISKGKGFAGAMKRHGFGGAPASHGAHKNHRKPGAVGQCATPSRVFKGKKMPGRMGNSKVTTLNLEVVKSDPEAGVLLVRGSVPGPRGGTVVIRDAVKGS
jgi:large subunit ribosomal protein L3